MAYARTASSNRGIVFSAVAGGNLMPPILDAVRAYATVGEMCDVLRDVWGEYEEIAVF